MPCPKKKAAVLPSHRGWIQPARMKITAAVLNVTGPVAESLWGGHRAHQREDWCSTSVALTERKILHWVSRIFHSHRWSCPWMPECLTVQRWEWVWAGKYLWARNLSKVYPQKKCWINQPSCVQIISECRQDVPKWNLPNFKSKTIRSKRSLLGATA